MFKVGDRTLTPDGRYGIVECVRKNSIVVRFSDGWFRSYEIKPDTKSANKQFKTKGGYIMDDAHYYHASEMCSIEARNSVLRKQILRMKAERMSTEEILKKKEVLLEENKKLAEEYGKERVLYNSVYGISISD